MSTKLSSQSGFSLVELLVAMVILAVGLLGLAELQVTAIKVNSQSESIVAATSLAQGVIEEITAMDSDESIFDSDLTNGVWGADPDLPTNLASPVTVEGGGTYNITYAVDAGYQGVTNLCLVTVTVASTTALQNVTGRQVRQVVVSTLKRAT